MAKFNTVAEFEAAKVARAKVESDLAQARQDLADMRERHKLEAAPLVAKINTLIQKTRERAKPKLTLAARDEAMDRVRGVAPAPSAPSEPEDDPKYQELLRLEAEAMARGDG